MSAGSSDNRMSSVLVDESFATQDDRFVDRVRSITSPKYLAGLADRWKKDPRPWAREQIFRYVSLPFDRPGHHPLVKRLFKHAESTGDSELMAAFLVAFDRLVRRERRKRYQYDYQTRQSWQEEELYAPRNQILPPPKDRVDVNPRTGERVTTPGYQRVPKNGRLFSYRTRGYLRRRVSRYFRRMGFQHPAEYPRAVAQALAMYGDQDLAKGENILDSWSLLNIAFRRSSVLLFKRSRVELADGRSLSELTAAPKFDTLWKKRESVPVLLRLVMQAHSRLVRVWAIQLLKREHTTNLQEITAEQILDLLDHSDQDVQQFGAGILQTHSGVDSWPVSMWLRLLNTRSVSALATICEAMTRRVRPDRLNLEECVALTCAQATPVARLGFAWLTERPIVDQRDRVILGRLAGVKCDAIANEATQFALSILGSSEFYRMEDVCPFFDSLNAQVRHGAWTWLTPSSPGYADASLWSRLLETPYDDVRIRLVEELNRRTRDSKGSHALLNQDLDTVWTSVLLGIHRGGRTKLKALRQISQTIADQPGRADRLVPVLAVAIRSVRPPEARAGLSAILVAVTARPELERVLEQHIPELRLSPRAGEP